MEKDFEEFMKEQWPGLHKRLGIPRVDFESQIKYDNIKEAFEAGFQAGMDKVLADYV